MKFLKGLIGFILFIVLVAIVVAGIVVVKVYNTTNDTPTYEEGEVIETSKMVTRLVSSSLVKTSDNEEISLTLNEDELNRLLASILKEKKEELDDLPVDILGAYSELNDGGISLFIPIKYFFIQSLVKLSLSFEQTNDSISISITDVRIGKLRVVNKLSKNIVKKIISNDELEELLLSLGFIVKADLENFKITIKKEDIKGTVLKAASDDPNKDLYSVLLDLFLSDDDLFKLELGSNSKFGASVKITKLLYSDTRDGEIPYTYDFDSIKEKVEYLLNNNLIVEENTSLAFNYLSLGYEAMEEENKKIIDEWNLDAIEIQNNKNYKGVVKKEKYTIEDAFNREIPSFDILNPLSALSLKITEDDLNKIFINMKVVGTSFAFARLEENKYKVSYIIMDSFFTDIYKDTIELKLTLNINGKDIVVKAICSGNKTNVLVIPVAFDDLCFGEIEGSDEERKSVLMYLKQTLATEDWIEIDSDNQTITFNFTKIFTTNTILQNLIEKSSRLTNEFIGEDLSSQGAINIAFDINLLP